MAIIGPLISEEYQKKFENFGRGLNFSLMHVVWKMRVMGLWQLCFIL